MGYKLGVGGRTLCTGMEMVFMGDGIHLFGGGCDCFGYMV